MSAELIFKTSSPKALEWWEEITAYKSEVAVRRAEYVKKLTELMGPSDRSDVREVYATFNYDGSSYINGIAIRGGEASNVPIGWRLDQRKWRLVPALKTEEGKAIRAEMNLLSERAYMESAPSIGIRTSADGPRNDEQGTGNIYFPGTHVDKDEDGKATTLYVTWGSGWVRGAAVATQAKVPEVEWVEIPLEEWIARG